MTKRKFTRSASLRSQSYDADAGTIDVVWTTGASVHRSDWDGDYVEALSLDAGAVLLDRLNAGAPFLDSHDAYGGVARVLGSVVPGSAAIENGRGVATILLSRAKADADTIGKIADGVIRNVSVGYWIHAQTKTEEDGVTTRTATLWEPLEISAVSVPADAGAQIRSAGGRSAVPRSSKSRRIIDIRRMAQAGRKPKFGERHVRAGTSADEFFKLLAERLTSSPEQRQMTKSTWDRDYERGRRAFEKLIGRGTRDDATDTSKTVDDEDEDQDRDDEDVCPKCGQPVDDGHDDDDDKSDQRAFSRGRTWEREYERGRRAFEKLTARTGVASARRP